MHQQQQEDPVPSAMGGRVRIFNSREWELEKNRVTNPKPRAKQASVKLYAEFLGSYHVHLACDICLQLTSAGFASIGDNRHDCSSDRLVLFNKSTDDRGRGKQIRSRSRKYYWRQSIGLCEHVRNDEECPDKQRCPCPHNDLEEKLWKRDENNELNISGFISDLAQSSLKSEHFVVHACQQYKGSFDFVCKICFLANGSFEGSMKKPHVPRCKNDHDWKQNRELVFRKDIEVIKIENDEVEDFSDEERDIINCIRCVDFKSDEDKDDIVNLSKQFMQKGTSDARSNSVSESDELRSPLSYDESDRKAPEDDFFFVKEDEQVYDSDCDDLLNLAAYDDDTGDSYAERGEKEPRKFSYYTMEPENDVSKLRKQEPDKYCRGTIHLQGPFDATFVPLDGKQISQGIKITGRKNCGPAFSGDEVVVEKTMARDSDTGEEVIRGTVIAVTKKNQNRRARTFVCTVDKNASNLMRPLCETVPKIHIIDSHVKEKYKDRFKQYLAVYYEDLKIRKVFHLDARRRKEMLFVVKYLKWDSVHMYPLGYAWKVIKRGEDEQSSQRVINIIHEVHSSDATAPCTNEVNSSDASAPCTTDADESKNANIKDAEDKRQDNRHLITISIDPDNCRDVDDALSLEILEDDTYRVGVHIADVSHEVIKDGPVDIEARQRAFSHYHGQNTYHMLPRQLAEVGLSLVANQERKAMSVIFTMNSEAEIAKSVILNSMVICKKNMTHQEAQKVIVNEADENLDVSVVNAVFVLNNLAQKLRSRRMGDGKYFFDYNPVYSEQNVADISFSEQYHDAKRLVEEFMILANCEIANFLIDKLPSNVPLRQQDLPDNDQRQLWQSRHSQILPLSFYFQQFPTLRVSRNDEAGSCVLLQENCDLLEKAIEARDIRCVKNIIGSELLHPLHGSAMIDWFKIQDSAKFVCSDSIYDNVGHFGLGVPHYVQFTSPIRRYMDIVVHRLVKVAITNPQANGPYDPDEIRRLCARMSPRVGIYRDFKRSSALLRVATTLETPRYMSCFIKTMDKYSIKLSAPYFDDGKLKQMKVRFSEMFVNGAPIVNDDAAILKWKKRLYDTRRSSTPNARADASDTRVLALDEMLHGRKIDGLQWKLVQDLIVSGNAGDISSDLIWPEGVNENVGDENDKMDESDEVYKDEANDEMPENEDNNDQDDELDDCDDSASDISHDSEDDMSQAGRSGLKDVTSEMARNRPLLNHFVRFSQKMSKGSIVRVLFGAETWGGCLVPAVKMINLTNSIDLCIEHRRHPVNCFAAVAIQRSQPMYDNISDYQEVWLAILGMEAATNASQTEDSVFCNHVPVSLRRRNGSYFGKIELQSDFCFERKMRLFSNEDHGEETSDYLCIRYQSSPAGENSFIRNIWVGHAVVLHTDEIEQENQEQEDQSSPVIKTTKFHMHFKVNSMSTSKPPPVLLNGAEWNMCMVEFIPRDLSDKRMCVCVNELLDSSTSELCRRIALGKDVSRIQDNFVQPDQQNDFDIDFKDGIKKSLRNNPTQERAIRKSQTGRFTLIQGPPGTGKTLMGVKIAYWFVRRNQEQDLESPDTAKGIRRQVLCCGPSNESVDVMAYQLRVRLGEKCPKIIRVYGEMREKLDYPVPRDVNAQLARKKRKNLPPDICLHHVIRQCGKPFSAEIMRYTRLFKKNRKTPQKISDATIEEYRRLILQASAEEMKNYDIILCTCSASASEKFEHGSNVCQIIIDECAMSMEPNSLIAIARFNSATQIVLLGDHKQLQPIVKNNEAKELGLNISLFERYKDRAIMLDTQYRMHPEICAFPSQFFYDGRLKTAPNSAWFQREDHLLDIWPKTQYPMVFCHVEGVEESTSVTTTEGNENSKSNKEERHHVRRIARELINTMAQRLGYKCPDPQRNIAILTQYNAQRAALEKELQEDGLTDLNIQTVVASQGDEWDYVILSTVRSLHPYELDLHPSPGWCKNKLGFVADEHQINVAITRARQGLIIVGNKNLLGCSSMWRALIDWYNARGCVMDAADFLPGPIVPGYRAGAIPRFQRQQQQQQQKF